MKSSLFRPKSKQERPLQREPSRGPAAYDFRPPPSSARPNSVHRSTSNVSSGGPGGSVEPNTLVVAVDFGTTFTGCAIANSSKIRNVSDKASITEHIEVLKRWPGAGNQAVEKTPSVLAYDNEFTRVIAWGSSVGDQHKNQFAHFKLLLHRPANRDSQSVDDLAWKLQATSIRSSSLPRGKTAVDVTADYLRPLYQYIQQILANTYGEKFLASQTLSYVITVPALWSDRSKALTQRAASEAGFNGKVMLVTEPEAAALYCATICDEVDLRVGSKFLVCDAGGGTVDLISYEVESVRPFMISECSIGTADACGSVFLNRAFEDAVRKRLGKYAEQVLKPRCLSEMIRHFDHFTKVEFKDDVDMINFAVPGAGDIPDAGIEDGFMTMTREELRDIFIPQFEKVLALINDQIQQVNSRFGPAAMRHVFLVGGLGSNEFLRKYLIQHLPREITVKQPLNSWTAVVRGAVMHGLNSRIVKQRVLRRHYGIATSVAWNNERHPLERRWKDKLDGTWRVDVMRWYAKKGQRVEDNARTEVELYYNFDDSEVLIRKCKLLACEKDVAPIYPDDPTIEQVCELEADLTAIPPREFVRKRAADGTLYYKLLYSIGMTFRNTIAFELIFNGKTYETVFAKYA